MVTINKRNCAALIVMIASVSGCVLKHPCDLELVSVALLNKRDVAELPAPPSPESRSLLDPYGDYLMKLREERENKYIEPKDVEKYFAWYSSNEGMKSLKPSSHVLKVEFSSKADLANEAFESGHIVGVSAYFCAVPEHRLLGSPYIYSSGLRLGPTFNYSLPSMNGVYVYYFFVNVSHDAKSPSSYSSYDLGREANDVCFHVTRGAMGFGYRSNVVVIPAGEIISALASAKELNSE